jgi:hypothetical protein
MPDPKIKALDKTPGLRGSQRVKEKMTTLLKVGYEAL